MNRKELVLKTFHNEPTEKLLVGFGITSCRMS